MENKKRKFDNIDSDNSSIHFDPSSIPLICYQIIFQNLPIESLISVSLTCKTWYNILCSNRFCYNKNTKLTLLNANQLVNISNSKILRHINKIELGKLENGLSINPLIRFQFNFTSLHVLKLCFISLTPSFLTNLFNCISQTLKRLSLAIQPHSKEQSVTSCLALLSSLHLLPNLTWFCILIRTSMRIEFDIEKYFKQLTKLEKLIIRQDNYTWKKSRIQQLTSIQSLPALKHVEWFEIEPDDLKLLSSIPCVPHLQYIHLERTLITNEILYYLSKLSTINTLKSYRFSPRKDKLDINGFNYLLSLKDTMKELEISTKYIERNEITVLQNPIDADCTEDEYEVYLTHEHINIFKQFIHLESLSLNKINITTEDLDNLLIHLAQYNHLKILYLDMVCFPSFIVISTIHSLEELSLAYPYNNRIEEYTDKNLLILSSLRNLKVLLLHYSMNLSKTIRQQLKEKILKKSPSITYGSNLMFEQLEEFVYNNDEEEEDND